MRGIAFLANGKMRINVRIVPALAVFSDNLKPSVCSSLIQIRWS
jgi:hypothetical protein